MKKGKRDQRPCELVQRHLPGLILSTILRIAEDLGDPYRAKPGLGGMTAYQPKAMAVVCILMEAEARTYRKMVSHLRMNRGLAMKIGLPKIPSKSTIWRAYGMIPESYLREVHTRIIGDVMVTGSVAGDSAGYSSNRFVRWFSIRHDQVRLKRGWVKLHSIVDVSTRTVLDYLVTDGYASDVAGMWPMLGRIEESTGFFCLDSAYLARKICDAISDKGMSTAHPAQVQHRLQELGQPGLGRYGQDAQGRAGPVHGRVPPAQHHRGRLWRNQENVRKPYFGSRKRARQSREIAIRVICYNIEVVARSHVKSGRLTHESLTAMAA